MKTVPRRFGSFASIQKNIHVPIKAWSADLLQEVVMIKPSPNALRGSIVVVNKELSNLSLKWGEAGAMLELAIPVPQRQP